jgi:HSP20 family protein
MPSSPSLNFDDALFSQNEGQLAVDVIETPDQIIIRSAIAGVKESALDIHVNEDMVTIRGERKMDPLPLNATVHFEECFWGAFSRSIILPSKVKADEAEASMKNGILVLTVPKAHHHVRVPVRHEPSL